MFDVAHVVYVDVSMNAECSWKETVDRIFAVENTENSLVKLIV